MKAIKRLSGSGNLSCGDTTIPAEYELTIWHDGRTNSRSADGRISSEEMTAHLLDFHKVPSAKLTLSNGDEVEVVFRQMDASGGTFSVNGPVPGTIY